MARLPPAGKLEGVAPVVIGLVSFAACVAGIANGFAQDDVAIIAEDTRLHEPANWPRLLVQPYWPPPHTPDQYRPVASLLLALQYLVGAGSPAVFRVVSYLLYAAASIGVYRLARQLLPRYVAIAVALLFAAHPVHVEAVALAVGQSETIVAIAVTLAVVHYTQRRVGASAKPTFRDWAIIMVLFIVAALSKEQGLLLPGFLLLSELVLCRGSWADRWRALAPGYIALGMVGIVILAIRFAVLGPQAAQPSIAEALIDKTFLGRVVTMFRLVPDWLRLLIWPAHLRLDYSPQEFVGSTAFRGRELFGLVSLLLLIALAWMSRRRAPVLTFGLAWTGLALLPVSNVFIPTGILLAERTMFLPSAGFLLAVGGGVAAVWDGRQGHEAAWQRSAVIAGLGALVVAGVVRSAFRQRVWRSDETLTLAAIEDSPRSWRAQLNYGELLFDRGDVAGGRQAYDRAIALAPRPPFARNLYAKRLRDIGDDAGALEQLELSLRQMPGQVEAISQFVAALLALGRYADARQIANAIIERENAPPVMVALRRLADSAAAIKAPPGSIRVTIPSATGR